MITKETQYTKDSTNKKLRVVREFDAPLKNVWAAWTEKELLDQWWAPRPWKTNTKSMDFRDGGSWLYAMTGPTGEQHWSLVEFEKTVPSKSFTAVCTFCDENGNKTNEFPAMIWMVDFSSVNDTTKVKVELSFDSEQDMEKIIAMGFKEGFAAAHGNLDELLAK
jgi:uncharacterized protein YndB with AHSA1/START domain